jgi:UDP-N-acetylmuramoyl-L-alanyl-D-glutamate--2,6-diaminopimelate ligase
LLGVFNKYNCLAAISVLQALSIPEDAIRQGISSFRPPAGRQEIVYHKDFMVINDFAHTPNSFAMILPEIKRLASNRLIHVFGAAARRDYYKRPEMGKISSQYADIIIVTAEDPRDEKIEKISSEIIGGMPTGKLQMIKKESIDDGMIMDKKKKYIFQISDRKEAIQFAIHLAQKGDIVLMTGKGHENSMNYGKGEEPWNETEIAKEAIRDKVGGNYAL